MSSSSSLDLRLRFLALDERGKAAVRALGPLVERELPGALDAFYDRIRAFPETRAFFGDEAHIQSAKGRQRSH